MAKTFLTPIDLSNNQLLNFVVQKLGSAPTGIAGKAYYNDADGTLYWYDGVASTWRSAGGESDHGALTGLADDDHPQYVKADGTRDFTATPQVNGNDIWHAGNDGPSSGLDADTLDGQHATAFETAGTAASAIAAHEAAGDPHSQYLTQAEGDALFLTQAEGDTRYVNETDFTKAAIDALNVDADTLDGLDSPHFLARANHTGTQLHTTISDFDAGVQANRLDQMAAPTAAVSLNSQKITGLATPTASTDAANKAYVDGLSQGLDAKPSVRVATTANITLSGTQTIDGVGVVAGDRVLVKDQSTASQNGIYVVAAGAWTRAADMDAAAEFPGAFTFVEQGTVNADTGWLATVDAPVTVGTTAVPWVQFSAAGQIIAGAGMTKTGNQLDVGQGTGVVVGADTVGVDLEWLQDSVGAMVAGNTESLITVVYQDGDGTIDFTVEPDLANYVNSLGWQTAAQVSSAISSTVNKAYVDALNVDADTLDGLDSTAFATAAHAHQGAYATTVGDGSSTSFVVTHNLGSTEVIVQLHKIDGTPDVVAEADVEITSLNSVTLRFSTPPAAGAIRVVVLSAATYAGTFTERRAKNVWAFGREGTLIATTGKSEFPVPFAGTLIDVRARVGTAPTGASVIVDVNKNGSTVFTTQANRPTIAAGAKASGAAVPDVTTFAEDDFMTVDIDQIGSGTPGSDLLVVLHFLEAL